VEAFWRFIVLDYDDHENMERVLRLGGDRPDALEVEMRRCRTTLCVGVLLTSCNPPRNHGLSRRAASLSESSTNIRPPLPFRSVFAIVAPAEGD
jgi:hypothetical protein